MTAHFRSTDTPFRTDRSVETDIANATPCIQSILDELNLLHGEFQSTYGTVLKSSVNIHLDVSYCMIRLGHFITIPCKLGHVLMHKLMCYLKTHMNKLLIFPKNASFSNRKIRLHWSSNESENFVFDSCLESFQDPNHASEKLLRSSYGIDVQTFLGTACS